MKPWAWALGVSLAFHLAALAVLAPSPSPSPSPSPPQGERVGVRADQIVSFTRVTLAGPPRGVLKSDPPVLPEPVPSGGLIRIPANPLGQNGGLVGISDNPVGQDGDPAASGVVEEVGPALTPTLSPSGGEGDTGTGPDLIALVHARLAAMADRCYPAAARRFQQRGTVQLSFCTDASGQAASTTVTQSSGAELLDAAARGCVVERAAPFPLEAASRCFSVPVRFGARPAQ